MSTVTKQSKNSVSLSAQAKSTNNLTVDEHSWTIDESETPSTVDSPKHVLLKTQKNTVSLTLQAKERSRWDTAEWDDGIWSE